MDVAEHYKELFAKSSQVLELSFSDGERSQLITCSHNFLLDYELMRRALEGRMESEMFELALQEYQFALYAVSVGQYRHAYIGLRLFMELALCSFHFSVRELELRQWLLNRRDIVWASLKDMEVGIFSKNFIGLFDAQLAEHGRQYCTIGEAVYRECSEYVHGNAKTYSAIPSELTFRHEVFCDWHEKAKTIRMVVMFAFCGRYLSSLDGSRKNELESPILETLGHLDCIRKYF